MQNDKMSMGVKTWCSVGLAPQVSVIKILGALREVSKNGILLPPVKNSVTTVFKNKSAQGAAVGTFLAINKAEITCSDASSYVVNTTKVAGGSGAEDHVTFEFEWENTTGGAKTINDIDMGYDMGGGGEAIYFQVTGLTKVVADNETIRYQWTITFAHSSGGVKALYRNRLAQMINSGTFTVGNKICFLDTGASPYTEVAVLEDGGTGAEAYHQWTATYTAAGAIIIDIITYNDTDCSPSQRYTEDDITNKSLVLNDTLQAHIKIEHA
jgi:hypothetical protein